MKLAVSAIIIICCLITAIIGIRESHLSKKEDRAFLGLTYSGIILIIVAIIASSATIIEKYLDYRDIRTREKIEQEKLKYVAIETRSALTPLLGFLHSFLSSNGQAQAFKVFSENYDNEIGKNYPSPHIMDKVIDVFSKSSLFLPSNAKTFPEGKPISWFQVFYNAIRESNYKLNVVLQHYGSVNHELIAVLNDLKIRSETPLLIMWAVKTHPDLRESWENGIRHEQHLDFLRHYFLTLVKINHHIIGILKEPIIPPAPPKKNK